MVPPALWAAWFLLGPLAAADQPWMYGRGKVDDFRPCLPNPPPKTILKNAKGEVRTLRVAAGNWDAPVILGRIAQILLNEGIGLEADFAHEWGGSGGVIRNMTGCLNQPCTEVEDFPFIHFDFENWFTAERDMILAAQPGVLTGDFIGYDGQEGLYVKKTIADAIWDKYEVPMAYYQALQKPNRVWMEFFEKTSNISIPNDSGCRGETATKMSNVGLTCDNDGWWYSPGCANAKDTCIPVLMGGVGWLGLETALVINYEKLPMAVTFLGWPDKRILEGQINALFFWWRPDWTYGQVGPVERLFFPKHDRAAWAKGVFETDFPDFQLGKWMWSGVPGLSFKAAKLWESFTFDWTEINKLMDEMEARKRDSDTDRKGTVACDWVKANKATWMTWFPDVEPCKTGQGRQTDGSCAACKQGSKSELNAGGELVCVQCAAGRSSTFLGGTSCDACAAGKFAETTHMSACSRCTVGEFTNVTGASVCSTCESQWAHSTTLFQGADKPQDCVCPKGMYNGELILQKRECFKCSEGHLCDKAGLLKPSQAKGYYIHAEKPSAVFLCEPKEACMGGDWAMSVCRAPRTGFMCMDCPDGMSLNNDMEEDMDLGCTDCSGITSGIVVLAPIVVFCFCLLIVHDTRDTPLDENPLMVETGNTVGQLVMFVQVINAIFATRMSFGEPMNGFFDSLVSHIDPDEIFSGTPCLANSLGDPVTAYSIVIFSPIILICFLFVAYFIGRVFKGVFKLDGIFNMIGEVLIEFYVSITLAIFAPFNCYGHPNGDTSVQKYPQIICGQGDHNAMLGLAVFGILAYPLMALAVSALMTWQHPRSMMRNDIRVLIVGKFLFDRWTPECYWFCNVSIARNFVIAVLPCVMPEEDLDVTILLMTLTLIFSLVALVWFKPRRNPWQNMLDSFVSVVQLTVVSFGVTSVHGQPLKESLSAMCVTLIVGVAFIVVVLVVFRLYQFAAKAISYAVYLSHHGGGGGTSCRVLHSILLKALMRKVFYDVDNMGHLGMMFDAAKVSKNVLVHFGSETLCRPWCLGAIVAAFRKGVPLHSIVFTHPAPADTVAYTGETGAYVKSFSGQTFSNAQSRKSTFEADTFKLRGYGLRQEHVHPAIQALTVLEPAFTNFLSETNLNNDLEELFGRMSSLQLGQSIQECIKEIFTSSKRCAQYKNATKASVGSNLNLVLSHHLDMEAISASRLLQTILGQNGNWIEDQDLASADYATIVRDGKPLNAVFVFSQYTLKSNSQLARVGLLVRCQPEMHMVPVVVGLSFDIPDESFLQNLEQGKVLDLGTNPAERLAALAGDSVSLKHCSNGLAHVMTFLISFCNISAMNEATIQKTLLDILKRATGTGRRTSFSNQEPRQLESAASQVAEPQATSAAQIDVTTV